MRRPFRSDEKGRTKGENKVLEEDVGHVPREVGARRGTLCQKPVRLQAFTGKAESLGDTVVSYIVCEIEFSREIT